MRLTSGLRKVFFRLKKLQKKEKVKKILKNRTHCAEKTECSTSCSQNASFLPKTKKTLRLKKLEHFPSLVKRNIVPLLGQKFGKSTKTSKLCFLFFTRHLLREYRQKFGYSAMFSPCPLVKRNLLQIKPQKFEYSVLARSNVFFRSYYLSTGSILRESGRLRINWKKISLVRFVVFF